jgi:hypothetical protein
MSASAPMAARGFKTSDRFCLSLYADHHAEHRIGDRELERRYGIDLLALTEADFANLALLATT